MTKCLNVLTDFHGRYLAVTDIFPLAVQSDKCLLVMLQGVMTETKLKNKHTIQCGQRTESNPIIFILQALRILELPVCLVTEQQ